jgi:large repetitive protein
MTFLSLHPVNLRGFNGTVTFAYALADGISPTKPTATVTLAVAAPPPVVVSAGNDSYTATFGAAFSPAAGNRLLANDQPPSGASVVGVASQPSGSAGAVTVAADGSFTFTPAAGWSGGTALRVLIVFTPFFSPRVLALTA